MIEAIDIFDIIMLIALFAIGWIAGKPHPIDPPHAGIRNFAIVCFWVIILMIGQQMLK